MGWTTPERDLGRRGSMSGSHAARTRATMPGRVVELLFKWAARGALKVIVDFSWSTLKFGEKRLTDLTINSKNKEHA